MQDTGGSEGLSLKRLRKVRHGCRSQRKRSQRPELAELAPSTVVLDPNAELGSIAAHALLSLPHRHPSADAGQAEVFYEGRATHGFLRHRMRHLKWTDA